MACLSDFSDFASKPTYTIHASLLYSLSLIEARIEELQHNSRACICESCSWARDARRLNQEFETNRQYSQNTAAN